MVSIYIKYLCLGYCPPGSAKHRLCQKILHDHVVWITSAIITFRSSGFYIDFFYFYFSFCITTICRSQNNFRLPNLWTDNLLPWTGVLPSVDRPYTKIYKRIILKFRGKILNKIYQRAFYFELF